MNTISNFLNKFTKITPPDDVVKRVFIDIVIEFTGVILKRADIVYKQGVMLVYVPAVIKSELYLAKSKILQELKNKLGPKAPVDIR